MREIVRTFLIFVLAAILLAIVAPFAIMAVRVSNTWTTENTGQLLGGALTCLGGVGAVFGALAGAGVFARLAGWKPPRRDAEQPPPVTIDAPPGWDDRPQLPAAPATPPWAMTGGGAFALLPAQGQDRRFSYDLSTPGAAADEAPPRVTVTGTRRQ